MDSYTIMKAIDIDNKNFKESYKGVSIGSLNKSFGAEFLNLPLNNYFHILSLSATIL